MRTNTCPADHKHGETPTCYRSHKCACFECKDANRVRCDEYKRLVAYGRPTGTMIDARPVQAHLGHLVIAGLMPAAIAAAAGIDLGTVRNIMNRRVPRKRTAPLRIFPSTAEKLLAVSTDLTTVPDGHWVDSRGARRRLQALGLKGWAIQYLAHRCDLDRHKFDRVLVSPRVFSSTNRAITALFEELWDKEPPTDTPIQRAVRTITTRRAQNEGWLPALAWDDIDLDDAPADASSEPELVDEVAVELALRGELVHLTKTERQLVIDRASDVGIFDSAIAPVLGITTRHIVRLRTHDEAAA
jgi:hypothetical protein